MIKEEEENTIFFKIDELYELHTAFLADLKTIVSHEGGDVLIGDPFKRMADMFDLYSAFLHNYKNAIDTVKKCSGTNPQFKKIVSTIVVNLQTEQSLTLEDLLHKPVARVQINALVFNDLLRRRRRTIPTTSRCARPRRSSRCSSISSMWSTSACPANRIAT